MSHTTKLNNVTIRDVSAMQSAVEALRAKGIQCSLVQNAKPRMYYSNQHSNSDYVLKLDNCPYDVGFDKQQDGTYAPVFDEWAGNVGRQLGAACPMPNTPEGRAQHQIGQFMQEYAKAATINQAIAQGYMVEGAETDQEGNVHLTLTGM